MTRLSPNIRITLGINGPNLSIKIQRLVLWVNKYNPTMYSL